MENTLENLRSYTLETIPAFDEENALGSYFVGWQEGFEPTYIEVQFCDTIRISADCAMGIAEERMAELNRGQNKESDLLHIRCF